jgi:hypothetical protein
MTGQSTSSVEISATATDGRIVLVGERGRLRGRVQVRNAEDRILRLRGAELHCQDLLFGGSGATGGNIAVVVSANLGPKQERLVNLTAELDPRTAAGDYVGELILGGSSQPVEIHVAESIRPRFTPAQIVIVYTGDEERVYRVYLANEGNVTLAVRDDYRVELGQEVLSGESAAFGQSPDGLQQLADAIVGSRPMLKRAGELAARVTNGGFNLAPGETRGIDLEVSLPDDLDGDSRYLGKLRFYTTDLEFVITPASG